MKKILIMFVFIILCSGCVKYNANMKIKKDKSMDLSITYAVNSAILGNESLFKDEDIKKMKENGYTLKEYNKDNMKGFIITKSYKNIDDVSSKTSPKYALSNVSDKKKSDEKIFKVKKGLFKNHYYASFSFDSNDSTLGNKSLNEENSISDEETNKDDTADNAFISEDNTTAEIDSNFDYNNLLNNSNMDLSFNVKLPYSAAMNNADKVNSDKKDLTWNLAKERKEDIKFEFELYNMTNIYIFAGIGILLVIVIIFIIIKLLKSKSNNITKESAPENISVLEN